MKKLKLFPKTYIFTMVLMTMIILISHTLLYMLLPTFYTDKKQKELSTITEMLVTQLENNNSENSMNIAKNFAMKYQLNITMTIGNNTKNFQGINQLNLYIDEDAFKGDYEIVPMVEDSEINNNLNGNLNSNKDNNKHLKLKGSSIIRNNNFKSSNGIKGNVKIIMNLDSVKEARSIIFKILPYSIGISLIISIIASYIYTKIITDPIKEICDVTKEMQGLDKDARCEIYTEDEIGLLSKNINSLYQTLWNTIDNLEEEIKNVSKSEKMKVDFLRSASHELKTPLMSIHIMLENMMLNIGKYKNHDIYLEKCKNEINRLSIMVQDILDTSRLNTWNEKNEYKNINVKDLIKKTISPYEITAKHKHIKVNADYSNSINIYTDENLLSKALSNIISNAVNYTDEGKNINIYFNKNSLIIENECKPIEKEHLNHIFEAFYRAEFDRNRNTGGNGLGLYIVKQILIALDIDYSFNQLEDGMKFTMIFN